MAGLTFVVFWTSAGFTIWVAGLAFELAMLGLVIGCVLIAVVTGVLIELTHLDCSLEFGVWSS